MPNSFEKNENITFTESSTLLGDLLNKEIEKVKTKEAISKNKEEVALKIQEQKEKSDGVMEDRKKIQEEVDLSKDLDSKNLALRAEKVEESGVARQRLAKDGITTKHLLEIKEWMGRFNADSKIGRKKLVQAFGGFDNFKSNEFAEEVFVNKEINIGTATEKDTERLNLSKQKRGSGVVTSKNVADIFRVLIAENYLRIETQTDGSTTYFANDKRAYKNTEFAQTTQAFELKDSDDAISREAAFALMNQDKKESSIQDRDADMDDEMRMQYDSEGEDFPIDQYDRKQNLAIAEQAELTYVDGAAGFTSKDYDSKSNEKDVQVLKKMDEITTASLERKEKERVELLRKQDLLEEGKRQFEKEAEEALEASNKIKEEILKNQREREEREEEKANLEKLKISNEQDIEIGRRKEIQDGLYDIADKLDDGEINFTKDDSDRITYNFDGIDVYVTGLDLPESHSDTEELNAAVSQRVLKSFKSIAGEIALNREALIGGDKIPDAAEGHHASLLKKHIEAAYEQEIFMESLRRGYGEGVDMSTLDTATVQDFESSKAIFINEMDALNDSNMDEQKFVEGELETAREAFEKDYDAKKGKWSSRFKRSVKGFFGGKSDADIFENNESYSDYKMKRDRLVSLQTQHAKNENLASFVEGEAGQDVAAAAAAARVAMLTDGGVLAKESEMMRSLEASSRLKTPEILKKTGALLSKAGRPMRYAMSAVIPTVALMTVFRETGAAEFVLDNAKNAAMFTATSILGVEAVRFGMSKIEKNLTLSGLEESMQEELSGAQMGFEGGWHTADDLMERTDKIKRKYAKYKKLLITARTAAIAGVFYATGEGLEYLTEGADIAASITPDGVSEVMPKSPESEVFNNVENIKAAEVLDTEVPESLDEGSPEEITKEISETSETVDNTAEDTITKAPASYEVSSKGFGEDMRNVRGVVEGQFSSSSPIAKFFEANNGSIYEITDKLGMTNMEGYDDVFVPEGGSLYAPAGSQIKLLEDAITIVGENGEEIYRAPIGADGTLDFANIKHSLRVLG